MPKVVKQSARQRHPVRRAKRVLDRIGPMDFGEKDGIKINLYGRSGTGKTTLWATFPGKILALVCSGSSKPGELRSIDTPANRKKIQTATITKTSDVQEVVDYQRDSGMYDTVVLDHASGLQDLTLKEVLGLEEIPPQLSWGLASREQYGQVALQMKERLRALLGLGCNVVIVAQERDFNTDGNGDLLMPFVGSALTPSVTGWLNPACDYICQTFIRQKTKIKTVKVQGKAIARTVKAQGVEYCLRTAPDPVFTTKFRIPKGRKLPEVIVDPDYGKLVKLIYGV